LNIGNPSLIPLLHLLQSYDTFQSWLSKINDGEGNFDTFTKGYEKMGFIVTENEVIYREWAPGVQAAFLIGDFSKSFFLNVKTIGTDSLTQ
jgi:1,4-alpha-glucan branching enzyme